MATFDSRYALIKKAIEDMGYGYRATDELVGDLTVELLSRYTVSCGCLTDRLGTGIFIWVKSRLLERGFFDFGWDSEPEERHVTCVFHFPSWDAEKYGEWDDHPQITTLIEQMASGVQRSPVQRLRDAKPINRTTYKVASEKGLQCPKCGRYFKTQERVKKHGEKCTGRGRNRTAKRNSKQDRRDGRRDGLAPSVD